jgi:hypothetical protein
MGGRGISPRGDEHVDDLPKLVNRAVHVAPLPRHLHIRLIHLPAVADGVPAGPSGLSQQRREAQHPPVDGDVVDLDPALGEQLFDVAVGQAEAQVPPNRQHNYIRREAEPGEGGARGDRPAGAVSGSHGRSVSARTTSRPTQQRPWRNIDDLELATLEWLDWYNNHRRLHSACDSRLPAEYETLNEPALTTPTPAVAP